MDVRTNSVVACATDLLMKRKKISLAQAQALLAEPGTERLKMRVHSKEFEYFLTPRREVLLVLADYAMLIDDCDRWRRQFEDADYDLPRVRTAFTESVDQGVLEGFRLRYRYDVRPGDRFDVLCRIEERITRGRPTTVAKVVEGLVELCVALDRLHGEPLEYVRTEAGIAVIWNSGKSWYDQPDGRLDLVQLVTDYLSAGKPFCGLIGNQVLRRQQREGV